MLTYLHVIAGYFNVYIADKLDKYDCISYKDNIQIYSNKIKFLLLT